jgi:DNA primase
LQAKCDNFSKFNFSFSHREFYDKSPATTATAADRGMKMSLLELLREDGYEPIFAASTNGGEYKGPCPFCGGEDRFCVWPHQGNGGRYWCRECEKHADAIQYLMESRGMTYPDACAFIGTPTRRAGLKSRKGRKPPWIPREAVAPSSTWQEKARKLIKTAEKQIESSASDCTQAYQWLKRRGLSAEIIKEAHLGWLSEDLWESRSAWGLDDRIEGGKRKKLWIPSGLVIPYVRGEGVLRLRIRRPKPDDDPKYYLVPGSDTRPMHWPAENQIYTVVESELDGLLLRQEVSDLTGIIVLGSAQKRPDQEVHEVLSQAELILVALDSDEAGAKATGRWWLRQYKQARWWPIPKQYGKDPTEAREAGLNLRSWIEAGLTQPMEEEKHVELTLEDLVAPSTQDTDNEGKAEVSIEDLLAK